VTFDDFHAAIQARAGRKSKRSGDTWENRCPAHEDKQPSLSYREGDGTDVVATCHRGCTFEQIIGALDLQTFSGSGKGDFESRIEATYDYVDEEGELLSQAVRLRAPKDFRQRRPKPGGEWDWKLGDVRRVVYRLPALREAAQTAGTAFVVEGEKDADALARLGLVATCSPMGASKNEDAPKWRDEYSASLAGLRWAIVVADCDGPGRAHARATCTSLHGAGVPCKLLDLAPDRDDGYDVSDFIAEHAERTPDLLRDLFRRTARWPLQEPPKLAIVTWGDFAASVGDYDATLDYLGPLLRGGNRVHVIGPIGHGKTTLLAEAVAAAVHGRDFLGFQGRGDVRGLYIELGDMAPEEIRDVLQAARFDLAGDRFDLAHLPDGLEVDRNEQHRRMLEDAMSRYQVVAIDPWYKLIGEELSDGMKNVRTVTAFLDGLRERFPRTAVVIGFHANEPQKGQRLRGVGDASGYKAFQRGADTAVLFERLYGDRSHLTWAKTRSARLPKMGERWLLEWTRGEGFRRIERPKPTDDLYAQVFADSDAWWDGYEMAEATGRPVRTCQDLSDRLEQDGRVVKRAQGRRSQWRRADADQTAIDVAA
jgi:hypothetical protein